MTDTLDYLRALYGDHTGRAHIGIGSGPYRDDAEKYKHRDWLPAHYAWPDQAEDLAGRIARESAAGRDVYCCVSLMRGAKRTPAGAAVRRVVHADVDGTLDLAEVERLGGFAVGSGTEGHGHAYIPLTEDVSEDVRKSLILGLRARLGGDNKLAANDVLRPPGTLNYKPTTQGRPAAPVVWLLRPSGALVAPEVLAQRLGVSLDLLDALNGSERAAIGDPANSAPRTVGPVTLAGLPGWVAEKVNDNTGDKSEDTMLIVGGCVDAGLTLDQTRAVVDLRPELAERARAMLARSTPRDDVAECYRKAQRNASTRYESDPGVSWAYPAAPPADTPQDVQNGTQDSPGAQDEAPADVMAELVAQELRKLIVRERARELYADSKRPPAEPFDADTLAGLLARPPEPRARIDELMPWSAGTLVTAQRKTGKTTLVANLARSLITGDDFLDRFAVRPVAGSVCVLNFEVSGAQFARWADDAAVPRDRLFVVNLRGRRNPLGHPEDRARLAALLRGREVETLIVDPFGRAYSGQSQNDAGEVGAWLTDLDLFARSEVGALDVILTNHAGWDGERSRGSSALEDWPDAIWTMTRDDDEDGARYLRAMGRDVDLDEDRLAYDPTTRRLSLSGAGSRKRVNANRKETELAEWVVRAVNANPGGVGVADLERAIRAMPGAPTFGNGAVSKAARKAHNDGEILRVEAGPGQKLLHYPSTSTQATGQLSPTPPDPSRTPPRMGPPTPTPPIGEGWGLGGAGDHSAPVESQEGLAAGGVVATPLDLFGGQPTGRTLAEAVDSLGGVCGRCSRFICECPAEVSA